MTTKADIGALEASGLIGLAALQPELEYLFRHVLVQDAAYSSLLKQERRELHRRVAEALIELYPERRAELAGVIGMHLEEAGEPLRAAPYLFEAGERALARFAAREARALFDRVLAALPAEGADPETTKLRLRAGIEAVRAGWTFAPTVGEIARVVELIPIAERVGDLRLLSEVHFWNAFMRGGQGETPETSLELRRSAERLEELSAAQTDPIARALPQAIMGAYLVFSGQLREGTQLLQKAAPVIDASGDAITASQLYQMLTLAYARLGDFAAAEVTASRGDRLAAEGDPIARLDSEITRASIASERGELDVAVTLAARCAADSEELGATLCGIPANYFLGDGRLRLGEADLAKPPFERMLQLGAGEAEGLAGLGALGRAGLAASVARLGDPNAALADFDAALAAARRFRDPFSEATILARRAAALARDGSPDQPALLADLEAAIAIFEKIGTRPALSRTLRAYSQALAGAGRGPEASVALERADAIRSELGLRDPDVVV
jgi:tetratricopeptide (TPR) repeat protein